MNSIPANICIYAIGDIHGRLDLLDKIHELIAKDAKKYPNAIFKIIYLGDYIDRGPHSKEVIDRFIHNPLKNFEAIHLKGNHENLLLDFFNGEDMNDLWLKNGGLETLMSYGVSLGEPSLLSAFQKKLPKEHLAFFQSLKLFHIEGDYFFCHAGINPDLPLDQQREEDLTWIRERFHHSQKNYGKVIVHGHSITEKPVMLPNRIGIDTGAVFTNRLTCLVLYNDKKYFLNT